MSIHKWKYGTPATDEQFEAMQDDFRQVLPYITNEGIAINGGFYEKAEIFNDYCVSFNGDLKNYTETFIMGQGINNSIDTRGKDYDIAVLCFLLIAKKHLGHGIHIETDEMDDTWRKAINLCQFILGHEYDLMDITKNGKLRFKTWELAEYCV